MMFPDVVGNFDMKSAVIKLLPKFHGLDYQSMYLHLKEFDEVCATLQYNNIIEGEIKPLYTQSNF